MKKTFWMITLILFLLALNITLIIVFYNKIFLDTDKTGAMNNVNDPVQITEKHPLEYLEINQKLSEKFNEYVLKNFKSNSTMNAKIEEFIVSKQGEDIVVNGTITNDSDIELHWVLMHINLYNSAGHKLDYIPYPVIYAKEGDKPLKPGESIELSHVFDGGFRMMNESNEWNGSFSIDILTTE